MLTAALVPTAAAAKDPGSQQVAVVRYFMPRTIVTATATLKLKSCTKPDANVDVVLSAHPEAETATTYTFDPTELRSWRQARDFSVTVNPNGTLAGFNSTSEDKTGAIIGNILKTVVSFASFLSVASGETDICNDVTRSAIKRANVLRSQLRKIRPVDWKDTDPLPGEKDAALAESLTTELAAIEASALTIVMVRDVALGGSSGKLPTGPIAISWPTAAFGKWFSPATLPLSLDAIRLTVTGAAPVPVSHAERCERFVEVPQPAIVTFKAKPTAGTPDVDATTALSVPIQQWGHVAKVCLDVPLFASRTVNATFDGYGLMTKLDWKSNARGEAASGALAAIAEQAAAFSAAVKPAGATADLKGQGDLLEQQIRVEKLRRCFELMQTGGICAS
jgi:hypothetical protein